MQDYITGPASLSTDDFARNKEFLARVLEGIFVHADGAISIEFKAQSLFAPVLSYRLSTSTPATDRPAARREHEKMFAGLQKMMKRERKKAVGAGPHFHVEEDGDAGVGYSATQEMKLDDVDGGGPMPAGWPGATAGGIDDGGTGGDSGPTRAGK